jgi:hypothetical protein
VADSELAAREADFVLRLQEAREAKTGLESEYYEAATDLAYANLDTTGENFEALDAAW